MAVHSLNIDPMKVLASLKVQTNALQDAVCASRARHVILRAARRVGKSYAAGKRIFSHKVVYPNTRGWIVGPSYDLAHKEFRYLLELTRQFCKQEHLGKPEGVRENPSAGDLYFRTPWGSEIIGKSAQKPETLVGEELDWLIMSEAALHHKRTWEQYLRPTLTTRKGISMWPFTPDAGGLWLYELERHAETLPDWEIFTGPAWDCPHYDPKEIAAAKRELSADAFNEQYGGKWTFYSGRVYQLQADIHFIQPFPIPKTWKVYAATDYGASQPTCTLWMAVSPDGAGYIFDEYYYDPRKTSTTRATADHVAAMRINDKGHTAQTTCRIADHHGLGSQLIRDFCLAHWPTVPCKSEDRQARRDRSITAFTIKDRPHPYHVREFAKPVSATGQYPDIFIFKGRCNDLERELSFLRWKQGTKDGKIEGDDHAADAMEYLIEYAGLGTQARSRRARLAGVETRHWQPACALTGY